MMEKLKLTPIEIGSNIHTKLYNEIDDKWKQQTTIEKKNKRRDIS